MGFKRPLSREKTCHTLMDEVLHQLIWFWSNHSDLTRPHLKWWLSKGNPLISGKPRLVKYYNLARWLIYHYLQGVIIYIPGGCLGFLNHQQYDIWSPKFPHMELHVGNFEETSFYLFFESLATQHYIGPQYVIWMFPKIVVPPNHPF